MSADVQELFDQAGRNAPAPALDADAVLRRARHHHRRRITGVVAATIAATVVVGVSLAGQANRPTAPDPAAPLPTTSAPGSLGRLAFELDGDIYVADWDGANRVRITDTVRPGAEEVCAGYWVDGPAWSPDGRHLAYRGDKNSGDARPDGCSMSTTVTISDPSRPPHRILPQLRLAHRVVARLQPGCHLGRLRAHVGDLGTRRGTPGAAHHAARVRVSTGDDTTPCGRSMARPSCCTAWRSPWTAPRRGCCCRTIRDPSRSSPSRPTVRTSRTCRRTGSTSRRLMVPGPASWSPKIPMTPCSGCTGAEWSPAGGQIAFVGHAGRRVVRREPCERAHPGRRGERDPGPAGRHGWWPPRVQLQDHVLPRGLTRSSSRGLTPRVRSPSGRSRPTVRPPTSGRRIRMGRVADPRPDGVSQGLTSPTAQGSVPHAFTGRPKALKISAGGNGAADPVPFWQPDR